VRSHPKWVWTGFGVAVAFIVVFFTLWYFNQRANEKAWALEAEASTLFHEPPPLPQPKEEGKETPKEMDKTERLKKAAGLYEEILTKYPRSHSAAIARFEAGNVYFELKEYDLAEKRYQEFLQKRSANKSLAAMVHLKLGYLYQAKGNDAEGLKQFRLAYEMEGAKNRDQAGFEVGRALEKGGSKEEASGVYKKVSEDFGQSPWGMEAKARLDRLNPPAAAAPAPSPAVPIEIGKEPAPAAPKQK
ncbi:MAG TPA: tetratricopeptide repeat protein, partial [Candidatus Manganitrophaceae bacterium]|nr:tetratricopeptide repeat protein [Candidatus Manganitrophaceae bacterium]